MLNQSPQTTTSDANTSGWLLRSLATRYKRLANPLEITEIGRCRDYLYTRKYYAKTNDKGAQGRSLPWEPYDQLFCASLADTSCRLLLIDKARQMRATWECAFYHLHKALFSGPWEIAIKGKTFEESVYIFERMQTMWEYLPEFLRKHSPMFPNRQEHKIRCPAYGSVLYLLGERHRGTQGKQWSDVMLDECAYMKDFSHVYAGVQPTQPRIVALSTPFGDVAWKRIVKDLPLKLSRGTL